MIKVLKWIYNRGRAYERMRLRQIAIETIAAIDHERTYNSYRLTDNIDQENIKRKEIDDKVYVILMRMINPELDAMPQASPAPIDKDKI